MPPNQETPRNVSEQSGFGGFISRLELHAGGFGRFAGGAASGVEVLSGSARTRVRAASVASLMLGIFLLDREPRTAES